MRILLTGGAGFLGSNLARMLVEEGYDVVILDNLSSGMAYNVAEIINCVEYVTGDVRNRRLVDRCLEEADGVIHLAGQISHYRSMVSPSLDVDVNVMGTLNILEGIRESGRRIPVIYASSRSVYGRKMSRPDDPPIDELARPEPIDIYGASKLACEHLGRLYDYHYGIPFVAYRMANLFGPRQAITPEYQFVAYAFYCVANSRPFEFMGDGLQTRDFLYVDDACRAYLLALENVDRLRGGIYNLGGKTYCTWRRVFETAGMVTGGEVRVRYVDYSPLRRRLENRYSRLDYSRIRRAVGWAPSTSLREGFERMYEYYRAYGWERHLKINL